MKGNDFFSQNNKDILACAKIFLSIIDCFNTEGLELKSKEVLILVGCLKKEMQQLEGEKYVPS